MQANSQDYTSDPFFTLQPERGFLYHLETRIKEKSPLGYTEEQKIFRKVKIYFMGKVKELYHFQLLGLLTRYQFPHTGPEYNLWEKTAAVFSDVRISMNKEGKAVKLNNLKKIQERWKVKRKELERVNRGSSVENYFNSVSVLLEDEILTLRYVLDYYRYGMFFNGSLLGTLRSASKRNTHVLDRLEESPVEEVWNYKQKEESTGETVFTVKASEESAEDGTGCRGMFYYSANRLCDGFMQIKYKNFRIKHSILWVG